MYITNSRSKPINFGMMVSYQEIDWRRVQADNADRGKGPNVVKAASGPQDEAKDLLRQVPLLDDVRNAMTSHSIHRSYMFCSKMSVKVTFIMTGHAFPEYGQLSAPTLCLCQHSLLHLFACKTK